MLSIPAGMTNASTDDLYSYMELKKKRSENMEREILQGSAMESDAPGMSAPAATELPAGEQKKRRREQGPLANTKNLAQAFH
jgi:hypothetical protein